MTLICPKCTNAIEQDHAAIPREGFATKCPSCNARVQLLRVSFARMAYFKVGVKSCSTCGNQLGHTLHCPSCSTIYPDFITAVDAAVLRRQTRERRRKRLFSTLQGIEFSLPSFKSDKNEIKKTGYTPQRVVKDKSSVAEKLHSTMLPKLIASLIVVIILAGGGYTAYARHKAEQVYMGSYFKGLYGVLTGAEMTIKLSSKIALDWKTTQEAGKVYVSRTMPDEEARLIKVKTEVDKFINQLAPPSDKYQKSKESLIALNKQYDKIHNLAITPPNTLPALNEALAASTAQLTKASQDLKAVLDEDMKAELVKAKQTYIILKEF